MTFTTGKCAVVIIGGNAGINNNCLEVILRDSGRYIKKLGDNYIALSNKKNRTVPISGTVGVSSPADYWYNHEENAVVSKFTTAEIFPQDLIDDFKPEDIELYGVISIFDFSITTEPSDAKARILGANVQYWISRQSLESFIPDDSILVNAYAYNFMPKVDETEGVLKTTMKKKIVPIFSPIKTDLMVRKEGDVVNLYSNITVWGYCGASTVGGSIAASATLDNKLIMGQGFLAEEVEELLSPSQ